MAPYSKPETVLKQAEGLISVGQSHAALQSLTEMFSSKRFRSTPLASLEPIMIRFVELCVDMRKGRTAKEGLMQYKNIAQNTSVASIEVVIKRFVQLADAKVQEAQEKADKAVALIDVDDLEASETPEGILLGAVSGDQNRDRTDRALVTPWLKFLWESYRTALETLKNNARLEAIYQQIAHQAFKFCLKHVRKVEFRRLCETLRLHLANVAKYSHQPHSINLSDPDTLQHHLDTRFAQLNTSVELELWQEAFRSVEDIHNLLTMAKKAPRPAMMANYYEKLTRIFLTSGNALFHAAAWSRYYAIIRTSGGKSDEELSKLAGLVLISALAVPVTPESEDEVEEGKGRNGRLTALLALSKMPTRVGLLNEALSRNTLKLSPIYVRALYEILEVSFEPLSICSKVAPVFRELAADASYAPYLPLLHRVLVTRLLSQLSEVYSSIKITHLLSLVAPLSEVVSNGKPSDEPSVATTIENWDREKLEAFIMSEAHRGELFVRVDHAQGTITFTQSVFTSTSVATVQPSPSSLVLSRISSLANTLNNALQTIHPPSQPSQEDRLQALVVAAQAERRAIVVRQLIVGRRRELLSEISVRKEKEEASRKAEQVRREKEEDAKRAVEDVRRREQERVRQTIEHNRAEEARRLAQALKGTLKGPVEEIDTSDPDALIRMQVAHLEKEKRELNERLRIVSKRVDHLERAFRKEERPMLSEDYERQQADDREAYEATLKDTIAASKEKFTMDMVTKRRLSRMLDDYKGRHDLILGKRQEELNIRKAAAQVKINEEKAKRRAAILKARDAERRKKEEEERLAREAEEARVLEQEALRAEEERKRAEAEADREAAEAKAREEEERREALRKQRAEERAAAVEASRRQQQHEDDAMRRREEKAAAGRVLPSRTGPPARATPTEAVWRRGSQAAATTTPPRSGADSSRPIPDSPSGPPRTRPIIFASKPGGGWKEREAAKEAAKKGDGSIVLAATATTTTTAAGNGEASSSPSTSTTAAATGRATAADDDGFQTVPKKAVWRPSRGRGSGI